MVSKEDIFQGIVKYTDNEIIPALPTSGKWAIGTIVTLILTKIDKIYSLIVENEYVRAMGITNGSGMIDIDLITEALIVNANKYGKLSIEIPMIGKLSFSDNDIKILKEYILGGKTE